MSNIIKFPGKEVPATNEPAGMVDLFPERHGMVLIDGCVPAAILPAFLALLGTAGVAATQNA